MNEFQLAADQKRKAAFQFDPERLEFLSDIVTTAIEGGIGYWSECQKYQWRNQPASAEIKDLEGEDPADWVLLDVYTVDCGIATILGSVKSVEISEGRVKQIAAASAVNDGGAIDAELADCIVQAALFGKVVYG